MHSLFGRQGKKRTVFKGSLGRKSLKEIHLPLTKNSIAGFSAITRKILNIKDAYDDLELKFIDRELIFDMSWDKESGYRTKSVLALPVPVHTACNIIGVFQALNKVNGFSDIDVTVMKQLSYLLNIALNNALLYQTIEDERKLKEYIIDNTEEGVCILDMKKRIVSASKFLEVMSGLRYPVQRMIGEYFFKLFPNFTNTPLEEKMNEALVYGFKRIVFLEVLEVKIIPYLDDKGRVKRLIVIFIPLEQKPYSEAKEKISA